MLQLGRLLVFVAQTISLTLWLVFTGYEHLSESHSSLLWLFTMRCMALLQATCPNNFVILLTCQPEPVFGHRLPVFLMFAHLAALLLVTAHLLQLVPGSGTLSLVMLLLQHRCCHFVENWRHTYFGSHILTLLCDLRHSGPCSFLLWPL